MARSLGRCQKSLFAPSLSFVSSSHRVTGRNNKRFITIYFAYVFIRELIFSSSSLAFANTFLSE